MADSKVNHEGALSEVQGKYRKASKIVKKASSAKKATDKMRKAKGLKKKPSRAWLKEPVKIRKLKPSSPLKGMKRAKAISPMSKVSLGPLKRARLAPQLPEWNGIELIPVISSNVGAIGYDEEDRILVISFLDQAIYEYFNVPEHVWLRFQVSSSKGRFVWSDIRDKFAYERVQ